MNLLIASIPHTGTMFVADHLLGSWPKRHIDYVGDGICYVRHFTDPFPEKLVNKMADCPTIIPLRAKEKVIQSWKRRKLDTDYLEFLFNRVLSLDNVYFLPLDSIDRDEIKSDIEYKIGCRFAEGWPIINSIGNA